MSSKRFHWGGYEFREEIEHGNRTVVLRLYGPDEEVVSASAPLLREEAAAKMLASEFVQEKIRARQAAKARATHA